MSRLSELLRQVEGKDERLAADLKREFEQLSKRRAFGLNFERHVPETVELPGRPVRKGDKVRFLPERGQSAAGLDRRLWQVAGFRHEGGKRIAELVRREQPEAEIEQAERAVADLVVVAEFRDPIFPGLKSTGKVTRGGDKPFHTVINAENYHALQALLYTHEGKVDAIYIDPPYNTGAKDWKYNNDYVDGEDAYRHSKWLAMMERRLKLAKRLLNPENSVLIVTIDEKEYLRLGLLLQQVFPEARTQMVSSVINPKGQSRTDAFARTDEYIFFVSLGDSQPKPATLSAEWRASEGTTTKDIRWQSLRRAGLRGAVRRSDRPNLFFPIFVHNDGTGVHSIGEPIGIDDVPDASSPPGTTAVWPERADGSDGYWQVSHVRVRELVEKGMLRAPTPKTSAIMYLKSGEAAKVDSGHYKVVGSRTDGSIETAPPEASSEFIPGTQWRISSHNAGVYGTSVNNSLIPGRRFPFPKSLYAVEDALRFFVADKPNATILDFFSGSGTTCHAVMRLNKQDGGQRQCISITNNEVSADEHKALREQGLRPGDPGWERLGICEYITQPRITAAITGTTPDGEPIKGDYKFTDEFPMADGFEENVEFFKLTYEAQRPVAHHRAFEAIAPLLWLKAGAKGRRIDQHVEGFDLADTYGVLFNLDSAEDFLSALEAAPGARMAFIVTDDDRGFAAVCRDLPAEVEAVRLYASYLSNFTINTERD
ncbi:MAG: hypothetical protein JJU31_09620 [Wenzhouxiangella sp.]|nr:hypothetical protein [Wenzhouxiangella sp.]